MTSGAVNAEAERPALEAFVESFIAAWNRHDAAQMASHWVQEGDLLNTRGHLAQGRAEIERLLTGEHAGPMRATRATMAVTGVRTLAPGLVLADARMMLEGLHSPDGQARPALPMHVAFVAVRRPEGWRYLAVRPYTFLSAL